VPQPAVPATSVARGGRSTAAAAARADEKRQVKAVVRMLARITSQSHQEYGERKSGKRRGAIPTEAINESQHACEAARG
jgi:hypothetical protein